MHTIRRAHERGYADHGWLQTHHSFSFAEYVDPAHMGWGNLRVINEDRVAPGQGFGTHGHRDMEIISYVLAGELAHQDSMGNGTTILPGEVQRMSAGTGVRHSEYNHATDRHTHFLQIWIYPDRSGVTPGYEQKAYTDAQKRGRLCLVASPDGAEGSLTLHTSAKLYVGHFHGDETATLALDPKRKAYVFVARGRLLVNGVLLDTSDAMALADEASLHLSGGFDAEVLVFDLSPQPAP